MVSDHRTGQIISFLAGCVRTVRSQLIAASASAVIWSIEVAVHAYAVKLIINRASACDAIISVENFFWPVALYASASLVRTANFRIYDWVALRLYPVLRMEVITHLVRYTGYQSYRFFQKSYVGEIASRLKETSKAVLEITKLIGEKWLRHVFSLLMTCGMLMNISVTLALIMVLWATFFISINVFAVKRAYQLSRNAAAAYHETMGLSIDQLANNLSVHLAASWQYERVRLKNKAYKYIMKEQDFRWLLLKIMLAQGLSLSFLMVSMVVALLYGLRGGYVTVGDFGLVLTLLMTVVTSVWSLAQEMGEFTEQWGKLTDGVQMLLAPYDMVEIEKAPALAVTEGKITFNQVSFSYQQNQKLFRQLQLTIPAGQRVALVGFSGGGKSTFVGLILRLFDPQEGEVLIDGQNIAHVSLESLRSAISVVPQDPVLFHRSILENIRYGSFNASDDDVIAAAKRAHAHDFIQNMPEGYQASAGERGLRLSVGQRQRILLARAILKNAPICILDEATSALDVVTEAAIQEGLKELMVGRTTIVIAHRLSTVRLMDRILVFAHGDIVEDGTHQELMALGKLYKSLWDTQSGGLFVSL